MTRSAAAKTNEAADALLAWLRDQNWASPRPSGESPSVPAPSQSDIATAPSARAEGSTGEQSAAVAVTANSAAPHPSWPAPESEPVATRGPRAVRVWDHVESSSTPLRLAHTDWLHHRLTVTGPEAALASFRAEACGAGIIPWRLDLDQIEEDSFHHLVAPPAPQQRMLSLAGARILARSLREAVARRHDLALAQVGRSRACPFDLHALLPVPHAVLRLGPDDPAALAWLWTHWGTTDSLRHVADDTDADPARQRNLAVGEGLFQLSFWSADWTPWRALAAVAGRFPALRFTVRPTYEAAS